MTLIITNKRSSYCMCQSKIEKICIRIDISFTSVTSNLFNDDIQCILTGCFLRDYLTNKV